MIYSIFRGVNERMTTNFPFPSEGKRYYTWSRYLKDQFGFKVFKVALDAGFDCPNRDGTVAFGGCTFCSAGSYIFTVFRINITNNEILIYICCYGYLWLFLWLEDGDDDCGYCRFNWNGIIS